MHSVNPLNMTFGPDPAGSTGSHTKWHAFSAHIAAASLVIVLGQVVIVVSKVRAVQP